VSHPIECQRCTACCRWPGDVVLSPAEITAIAAHQKISEDEFIQQFTRLRRDRRGLALVEQADGACVFLDGNRCVIQAVKPQQCREFPRRWVDELWGRVPLAKMRQEYPMLFACAAFKKFLGTHSPPPD